VRPTALKRETNRARTTAGPARLHMFLPGQRPLRVRIITGPLPSFHFQSGREADDWCCLLLGSPNTRTCVPRNPEPPWFHLAPSRSGASRRRTAHPITSSACSRHDCGILKPSALAVVMLMISPNLVGGATGSWHLARPVTNHSVMRDSCQFAPR